MAGSSSIVDWNAVSLNNGIRLLARVMRQNLGVRLYAVTPDGECVDLTPPEPGVETVFDHFAETDARWGQDDSRASMVETRRQWAQKIEESIDDDGPSGRRSGIVETAPGFSAHIVPIFYRHQLQAGLVVAGFVPTEKAATRVEAIQNILPQHLKKAIADGDGPTIAQVPREDRKWLDHLAEMIATKIEEDLNQAAPSRIDESSERFAGMLGKSEQMRKVFRKIEKVARTGSTVLITGENGTGKELVARAVHNLSDRREQPFLAVNCAAIPADLIASELFGHIKGSFSGAHRDRMGLFEAADGGTLLLDEIGDMEPSLQTKLLRILQEGTLVRVGDHEERKVDVRVLCATNSALESLVRSGEFRRDLYFRIRVIKLDIPPLRDRHDDVELLAKYFVSGAASRHGTIAKKLDEEVLTRLKRYRWPGNVRELENEIERLVIMSGEEEKIGSKWLSPRMIDADEPERALDFAGYELPEAIEIVERKMILEGLIRTGWNKTQTARELGVSRRNLIRKVAHYELEALREDN